MIIVASVCENSGILESIYIIKKVLNILFIMAPSLLIITTMISFFKALMGSGELKNEVKTAINKIVIAGIIIFVPLIVNAFIKLINNGTASETFLSCYDGATQENITYYKNIEKEDAEKKASERAAQAEANRKANEEKEQQRREQAQANQNNNSSTGNNSSGNGTSGSGSSESNNSIPSDTTNKNVSGVLYVGDSRTVGMYFSVYGGSYSSEINVTQSQQRWYAKVGSNYTWFTNYAVPYIKNYVQSGNYTVTIQMGANDLYSSSRANNYINTISSLADSYPNSNFVIISVNPVNDSKAANAGYSVTNAQVLAFNGVYKTAISSSGRSNISYCDTYSSIASSYGTSDGLHYDNATNKTIYNRIGNCI